MLLDWLSKIIIIIIIIILSLASQDEFKIAEFLQK